MNFCEICLLIVAVGKVILDEVCYVMFVRFLDVKLVSQCCYIIFLIFVKSAF